jgi:hypothetical protein
MAAIRHEPAMADAGLGRGCIPVILPVQLTREKIPVNFLLFTGSLDSLSQKLSFRIRRLTDRSERRLTHRQQTIPGRHLLAGVFVRLRNRFDIFAQTKPTSAQTKPTGKTVVKTTFEHEQHGGWPNEPDGARRRRAFWPNEPERVQSGQRSRWGRRKAGHESPLDQVRPCYSLAAVAGGSSATGRSNLLGG